MKRVRYLNMYWPHLHEAVTDINGPQMIPNDFINYLTFEKLMEKFP